MLGGGGAGVCMAGGHAWQGGAAFLNRRRGHYMGW